jgi:single-strand DNA-binding protein
MDKHRQFVGTHQIPGFDAIHDLCVIFMVSICKMERHGFVGSNPEQRQAKGNGSKFTVLSVATQRSWKNADDEWSSKTEWHRVVVFRPLLAERVATTIKKGAHVLVEGSLVSSTYEQPNGKGKKSAPTKTTSRSIRADVLRKLDRGEPEPETVASGSAASSEALDGSDPAPF